MLAVHPEPFDQKFLSFTPPMPSEIPPERTLPDAKKTDDGKGWTVKAALKVPSPDPHPHLHPNLLPLPHPHQPHPHALTCFLLHAARSACKSHCGR